MPSTGVYKSEERALAMAASKSLAWLCPILVVRDRLHASAVYYLVQDNEFNRAHSEWVYAVKTERP